MARATKVFDRSWPSADGHESQLLESQIAKLDLLGSSRPPAAPVCPLQPLKTIACETALGQLRAFVSDRYVDGNTP